MTQVTLTLAQIAAGLTRSGFRLGAGQYSFSVPGAASVWPGYSAGTEPFTGYAIVTPEQAAAFRLALAGWDELILPNFSEVADDAGTRGEIRVALTSYDMDGGTSAYAYSGTPQTSGGRVGDVWINAANAGQSFARGTYNFEVLIHELGHTLGLTHSFGDPAIPAPFENTRYTVMSYTAATASTIVGFEANGASIRAVFSKALAATPMVLDVAAVQGIYGADPTTRSGDTVYAFDQDDARFRTIYDAGGIDTIDLSGVMRPNIIDLTPGAYSTIGAYARAQQAEFWIAQFPNFANFINATLARNDLFTRADTVGIAFGTLIENATGGAGADRITGNAAANVLLGMGGGDTLIGGDGDDRLDGGSGGDTLTGGAGADVFVFREAAYDSDTVTDFAVAEDRFDLVGRQFSGIREDAGGTTLSYGGGEIHLAGVTGLTLAQVNARVIGIAGSGSGSVLSALYPADGATGLSPTGDIRLVFAGAVARGSGLATLTLAGGEVVETFDLATSARVGIAGNVVTIDPTRPLIAGEHYTLAVAGGGFSVGGASYAGLAGYDFQVRAATAAAQFQLLVGDGAAATVSGSGTVFGTRDSLQDVTVLDTPGQVTFDPSFNAGGDRIRLSGAAADYTGSRSGSTVLLNDGDTIVAVPVGPADIDIVFADGIRTLALDTVAGLVRLGGQVMTTGAAILTAPAGAATATGAVTPGQAVLLLVNEGRAATAHGTATVFGTRGGAEGVTLAKGAAVVLDPSFNAGGDSVSLPGDAATYSVARSGSAVVLTSASESVTLPVGVVGMAVRFDNAVRTLVFDAGAGAIKLGAQTVGASAVTVAAPPPPTPVALAATQDAAGGDYRYVHGGAGVADATVTGFARGDSLALSGDAARYIFASDGGDLRVGYVGDDGAVRTTTLVGVADPSVYVRDLASASVAIGFDFAGFGP